MRVLFLSCSHERGTQNSAYEYRLSQLRNLLETHDIETDYAALATMPFSHPDLVQPLNLACLLKKARGFDYIHAGGDASYTAVFAKRFMDIKVINDYHGDLVCESRLNWERHPSLKSLYVLLQAQITCAIAHRYSDFFLTVSNPQTERLVREHHIGPARICLVRNGVDLEFFRPVECTGHPQMGERNFSVCYAGAFQTYQGIASLIDAFELIHEPNIHFQIIGFTPEDQALKSSIANRLGDRAKLIDRLPQQALRNQLLQASVLVIPRFRHRAVEVAFPTKFAEFIALGKPVIVCNVDETSKMVRDYHCGFVSEPDAKALAQTIMVAYRTSQDHLNQMGANARRLAEREFSYMDIGKRYSKFLEHW